MQVCRDDRANGAGKAHVNAMSAGSLIGFLPSTNVVHLGPLTLHMYGLM